MPFEVIWTNRSKKDLKLIDKETVLRIINKISVLENQDTVFLERVKGTKLYKFRVGSYRVLIEKFPATKKLFVLKVRHRRRFYKNI